MAGKPIATLGSMHVCPMVTGYIPHIGGPVSGPGAPNVLINGKPAALMGDMCVCTGPPDTIAQGEPTVLINGTPVATMGSMTAHGGSIIMGEPNVLISSATPNKKATMPLKRIPFPKITILDHVGAAMRGKSADLKQAEQNQKQLKQEAEEAEKEPRIYGLQWRYNEATTSDTQIENKVMLTAKVTGIDDGEELTFAVYIKEDKEDIFITEVKGKVEDSEACAEWEFKKEDLSDTEQKGVDIEKQFFGNYYFTVSYE